MLLFISIALSFICYQKFQIKFQNKFQSGVSWERLYVETQPIRSEPDHCSTVRCLPRDKPTIVFCCGGGYWPYYLGIAKFIKENYDLSQVCIVGTSAGALAALSLSQPVSIDDVLVESFRVIDELSMSPLGIFSLQWPRLYRKGILAGLNGKFRVTENLFIAVSRLKWFGFEKRYFVADSNAEAISDAAICSCWIPLITSPLFQPLYRIGGFLYGDGYWTGKDIIQRENTIVFHPRKFERMSLSNHWLWLDKDRLYRLYELGYEHSRNNRNIFSRLTLIDETPT